MMWNWLAWNKTNQRPAILPYAVSTADLSERRASALASPSIALASICTWSGELRKDANGVVAPAKTRAPANVRGTEPGNVAWSNLSAMADVALAHGTP